MPLAIVAALILLMKVAEIGPVATWSWLWVLLPWGVLMLWWEVITPLIGWDKKVAAKRIQEEERRKREHSKKMRGF